jgi:hypothetical protein
MRLFSSLIFISFCWLSCSESKDKCIGPCGENMNRVELPDTPEEAMVMKAIADTSTVGSAEFNENKLKIEAVYGEQWGFCECVVKGDSINKAFSKADISEEEFDRLSKRFDVIDEKCQAFRTQDANRTPEERALHEKKVRKCLKAAGIK